MSDWTQAQDHWQCQEEPSLEPAIAGWRALIAYYCHPIDSRERP